MANKEIPTSNSSKKVGRTPKEKKAAKQAKVVAQTAARKSWENK